ncbi:MAG: beta-1,6-N-acetylglucosaminyltransferase [Liquorilactobacillus satsumensis]|uniref:beta-1,6-N-acetylglucosaminyltransferase n=1 Tax=Liquorilactobacillus satsumensis TaxID=259059 RepID=UPI001E58C5E7|nr:beta-1,6-N-acetylglucosaminyltransferase [Liquorilactobacillus satsumensis]MCC7667106.1 hypothetical protein [Liquorilactobacillus satsumensis]
MRHAILVIGHGDSSVLQETIKVLDDKDIDFYIHWDKKFPKPALKATNSNLIFIDRMKVYWGTDSQVIVEKKLIAAVVNSKNNYDYVHLISSTDIPLMDKNYFKRYFSKDAYVGFADKIDFSIRKRMMWFYPIRQVNIRGRLKYKIIIKPIEAINLVFCINRLRKHSEIEKGTNWFSIRYGLAVEVYNYRKFNRFLNTFFR